VVTANGGEIRTGARVEEIVMRADEATGVRLCDGEVVPAKEVVAATDPITLMRGLVPQDRIPDQTDRELRGLAVQANQMQLFKADVALSSMPDVSIGRTRELVDTGCYVILAPSYDYIRRAVDNNVRGELGAAETLLWYSIPSRSDRTMVPHGSTGETLYVYGPAAPMSPMGGDWEVEGEKYLAHCLDIIDTTYLPGVLEKVIGSYVRHPGRLAERATKGSIWHVDIIPTQLGPWRPVPSMSGYKTPFAHLWHTGSGAHPMGGVSGWAGRASAGTVSRAMGD